MDKMTKASSMPPSCLITHPITLVVAINLILLSTQCDSYIHSGRSVNLGKIVGRGGISGVCGIILGMRHHPASSTDSCGSFSIDESSPQSHTHRMPMYSPWKSRLHLSSTSHEVIDGSTDSSSSSLGANNAIANDAMSTTKNEGNNIDNIENNDGTKDTNIIKSNNEIDKRDKIDKNDQIKTRDLLSLDYIRSTLIRQEETIIFALIERAQFRQNELVYRVGGVPGLGVPPGSVGGGDGDGDGEELSFLDFMLIGTEVLHSAVRRYESPEEHAFFPSRLPSRTNSLSHLDYNPELLSDDPAINSLNWNAILYEKYIRVIVPAIADGGDDEQHGSTTLADIAALQALSKRIHFGKFVAESKYRSNPAEFQKLVDAGDADGVMKLLTNEKVEELVLTRARLKAATYGREPMLSSLPSVGRNGEIDDSTAIIAAAAAAAVVAAVEAVQSQKNDGSGECTEHSKRMKGKVDPGIIESIYRQLIIPMTKDIEVAYLFLRCGKEPPAEYSSDRMSIDVMKLSPRRIS